MSQQPSPSKSRYLVGVGASAGGLEALTSFVKPFSKEINCSLIVIQHLSPNYRSMMVELVDRETRLEVLEAEEGTIPKAGTIYIAPPKWDLIIQNGKLSLVEPAGIITPKPSANRFLYSLAEDCEEFAISVILSGTGSDGSAGSRAIKAGGGITFAQEPDSAKYNGMPQSAINTGAIDHVMKPNEIAQEIINLVQTGPKNPDEEPNETEAELFNRLFKMVRRETKIDFSGYKRSMLWRRIHRRMASNRITTFENYVHYIEENGIELTSLSKDILISVTAFFRDPAVFKALKNELTKKIAAKQPGEEIRIWVPGCATGEEAYTIGIILYDILGPSIHDYSVQIFATDIDLDALEFARQGVYQAASLDSLDHSLIESYFNQRKHDFEVKKVIRDLIVFARQDVVIDPPFLRLDLVTCRNLLIYFDNPLQRKILHMVNYALEEGGLLLLGKSESISQNESLFKPVQATQKLFTTAGHAQYSPTTGKREKFDSPPRNQKAKKSRDLDTERVFRKLADRYFTVPAILLDRSFKLLMANGEIEPFIHIPKGKAELDISLMINSELNAEVLSMLHSARRRQKIIKGRHRRILPSPRGLTQMVVVTGKDLKLGEVFLLGFSEIPASRSKRSDSSSLSPRAMEDELATTREHLQTLSEELETSNEELQALNEEVQASNEELQASNEELEASNEELQATNEELVTVNEELLVKSSELSAINADFSAVNNSFDFPVIVLDSVLQISRINKSALKMLGNMLTIPGTPFQEISFDDGTLTVEQLNEVNQKGVQVNLLHFFKKRYYHVQLTPCFDQLDRNHGVIITMVDQHDLRTAEKDARDSRNFLMSIMDNSVLMTTVKDIVGRYEFANKAFLDRFGLIDVTGATDQKLFNKEINTVFRHNDLKVLENQQVLVSEEHFSWQDQDIAIESIRFPLLSEDGLPYAICTQSTDITLVKKHRDQLKLAATVIEKAAEGIMVTDTEQNIISINDSFTRITGYKAEDVIGKQPRLLASKLHDRDFYSDMWFSINQKGWWQGEITNRQKNGDLLPEWLTINEVRNEQNELINYLGIFSDISVIKRSQEHAEYLSTHDDLTNMPNRMLLKDRLKHALARSTRNTSSLALMFCDLDNFKVINDTLGHETGDQLLVEVANRLNLCVREQDTVARVGGDEFIVLVEDAQADEIEVMAKRILDALSASFRISNRDLYVSLSIGISQYPDDGADSETLMKHADAAMYKSKESGKNQYTFFAEEMRFASQRRLTIETGIRMAIKNNEFFMMYQPILCTESGEITSLEALIRWDNEFFPSIEPANFIPVAEQSGLITLLDQWVIRQVMYDVKQWLSQGLTPPHIALNLSAQHFDSENLRDYLSEQLDFNQLEGNHFVLEMTENTLVESLSVSQAVLERIVEMGFSIAIDDFGTGYSSLSYLQKLPIDIIKIDRSFIDEIHKKNDDFHIARAIISMANSLGLDVIAEGVELEEQLQTLKELKCRKVQGFLFAKPSSFDDISKLLKQKMPHSKVDKYAGPD